MTLKKADIQHMVKSVAAATGFRDLVMVGSGALIATAKHLPASLMMTQEADIFARDAADPDHAEQLIDGTFGIGSQFHTTFGYFVDAVSPGTAVLPRGWQDRTTIMKVPGNEGATITIIGAEDLAVAKIAAWREKDREWLGTCLNMRLVKAEKIPALLAEVAQEDLERFALSHQELARRFACLSPTKQTVAAGKIEKVDQAGTRKKQPDPNEP